MNIDFGNPFLTRLTQLYFRLWRPGVLILGLAAVVYLLYFHHLGTLVPGYSFSELQAYFTGTDWHHISTDPVNAPYAVPVWLLAAVAHHSLISTRIVAACFGIVAVVLFFSIIRPWYSFRIASLGTLLFATSGGFLHVARLGTPQVLQMGLLALLACVLWYKRSPGHRTLIGYVVVAVCALLLYIPGMVWFEALGIVLLWKTLLGQVRRRSNVHLVNQVLLFLVVVAPLIRAAVWSPHLLLVITGLPNTLEGYSHIATNFYHAVLTIGVHSNQTPLLGIGHVPLLNTAELVLGALGVYAYLYHKRAVRTVFLLGAAAVSLLLISFGGSAGIATLVPLLYLLIVHGLDHLLGLWFTVFPRNPIARMTGVAVVCVLLVFSILYQVRAYFVAWPHNSATQQTFNLSREQTNLLQ